MFKIIEQRLTLKLGLLATVAVALGFSLASIMSTETLLKSTARLHRESAVGITTSIGASLRTAMLAGDGAHVRRLVSEVKTQLPQVGIRIFSAHGEEVFGAKASTPKPEQVPVLVRAVIASGKSAENAEARALPIVRQERCRACHAQGDLLGVLSVGAAAPPRSSADRLRALDTLTTVIRDGFYRVMLAPTAPSFNAYFTELTQSVPGVRNVAVYRPDGQLAYGKPTPRNAKLLVRVATVHSEPRCLGCHEDAKAVDGSTIAVAFDPEQAMAHDTLALSIEAVLKQVMLTGLGRLATGFFDDVAKSGALRSLTLHDAQGRLIYNAFARASPPADVAQVLRTGALHASASDSGPEYVLIEPLQNTRPCQTCHGSDSTVRGAIELRLNTSAVQAELASLRQSSAVYGSLTIILVLVLLALGLYYTVILPVREIGSVADQVGVGQLNAKVKLDSADEMGRLGRHINEMVRGLRQKLELSKFVSHDTLHKVESSVGTVARGGERRRIAVVFSDIRGFTSFAESHEPEVVVEMLNRCLQAQAVVVLRHGGDINKFVGDEIMARFNGPDMALLATRAAVEMAEAVALLNTSLAGNTKATAVGVGVSVGEAVLGAMGAERRMDFTAIGDTVNLGARLCSAAGPGEVFVTEAVRREIGAAEGLEFKALKPMMVKGKQEPVVVYRVLRESWQQAAG